MKTCVFVGPSAGTCTLPEGIDRFSPAAQGSVFLAVDAGYERIGLADGLFGNVPSVWHKEILFALSLGVEVVGASSIGALRAAELWPLGMRGIGRIFRYYRSGAILDDDEVCVLHSVRELNFAPLSIAMVSLRRALKKLRKFQYIDKNEELKILSHMKSIHFSNRNNETLHNAFHAEFGANRASELALAFKFFYKDQKIEDYHELLIYLCNDTILTPPRLVWSEIVTRKWKPQFEDSKDEILPLERW